MQAGSRYHENDAAQPDDECACRRKNVEAARLKLNEVMMERKTHEKLKEQAFEVFKQEMQYAENKEIDELVSYTYHEGMTETR